jgi:hypothetical protein
MVIIKRLNPIECKITYLFTKESIYPTHFPSSNNNIMPFSTQRNLFQLLQSNVSIGLSWLQTTYPSSDL